MDKVHEQRVEADDFDVGQVAEDSCAISTRSASGKRGCLDGLSAIARISLSNSVAARRTRSSWPRVIGSKVPGIDRYAMIEFFKLMYRSRRNK
jgi:hypothetical protein